MDTEGRYRRLVDGLYGLRRFGVRLGLDNIRRLCGRLGEPQRAFRAVHVAGTNGKGSVAALVEAMLRGAGMRVGLFTSPHLVSFTERIQIDRVPVSESTVLDMYDAMRPHLDEMAAAGPGGQITFFEVATALAMMAFRDAGVDWAVMETGMGGRLDATNLLEPALCLITSIDLDHMEYLGGTLEAIAREKAGILKAGVPAIALRQRPEVEEVLVDVAKERGVPLAFVDASCLELVSMEVGGQIFRRGGREWRLRLLGEHQLANAALALAAGEALARAGVPIDDRVMAGALATVEWPGRFQIAATDPLVVLDGAHNPAGAKALARCFTRFAGEGGCNLIFSALSDKAVGEMVGVLAPMASWAAVVPVASSRSICPRDVFGLFRVANPACEAGAYAGFGEAWDARPAGRPTLVAGSLFLVGEALSFVGDHPAGVMAKWVRRG